MTIQEFHKKAEEGGWRNKDVYMCKHDGIEMMQNGAFLDPKMWQAVGKVEGWTNDYYLTWENNDMRKDIDSGSIYIDAWQMNMHAMIDALAEGKDLQSFIKSL